MPDVALGEDGRGTLNMADVLVTWVFTDVAGSTKLWEYDSEAMDAAINLHNECIRGLLDEFAGHEIRNEGDSFTLAFHDALDAVQFCLRAQEALQALDWPRELLEHDLCKTVTLGDLLGHPAGAGKGPAVLSGLRVRMGVNTGCPLDIFMNDVTEQVDYRGIHYDLAGEICDMAAGGQILLGPRTFAKWNKVK